MTTNHFPHTAQTEWSQPTLLADVLDLSERVADLTARVTAAEDGQGDALRAEFAGLDHEACLIVAAHRLRLPLHQVRAAHEATRHLDAVALAACTPRDIGTGDRDNPTLPALELVEQSGWVLNPDDVVGYLEALNDKVTDLEDGPVYRLARTVAVLAEHLHVDLIGLLADADELTDITLAVECSGDDQ